MKNHEAPTIERATSAENSAPRAYISRIGSAYETSFEAGLEFVGVLKKLNRGDRIAIKPNLTYPTFRPGVMTNPSAVEALLKILADRGCRITICESDSGGYNPFSMNDVFRATGLDKLAERMGVRIANLSNEPSRSITVRSGLRTLQVPLPRLVLDETDWFISMPVPKVHLNTVLSLSIKNQWGIIQQPSVRLRLHPYFTEVIEAITKSLPRPIAVMDGRYGLTRSGPMKGDAVELGWTLVTSDLYACDLIASSLLGVDFRRVPHLKAILGRARCENLSQVVINADLEDFRAKPFHLTRQWTDYPGLLTFKSRALAYVGYESPLARPLHWLLYRFREPFY